MNTSVSLSSLARHDAESVNTADIVTTTINDSTVVLNSRNELVQYLGSSIAKKRDEIAGDNLSNKIVPIQTLSGEWVILALPDYSNSDFIKPIKEKCKQAGAPREIRVVVASPYLMLSLSQQDGNDILEVSTDDDPSGHFATFTDIIRYGIENNASDVHLNVEERETESRIKFTIEGQYTAPPQWRMDTARLVEVINIAWQKGTGGGSSVFTEKTEAQCRLVLRIGKEKIMCRWASLAADRGVSVTLRLLKLDLMVQRRSLESQGFLPSQIEQFLRAQTAEGGAIVIAGVVNSGKSTALAENLSMIPDHRKIVTLEDPVEYLIPGALQNTVVRSLDGRDDEAFTSKLKTFKRSAPNDILIGEIRDTQTGDAFVDITGSGTNLYCTTHAKSNFQIPERLASKAIGIPVDFLASPGILNLLVYMALMPVLCQNCALPLATLRNGRSKDRRGIEHDEVYWGEYIDRIERLFNVDSSTIRIKCDEGCDVCRHSDLKQLNGYQGRTAVASMLEPQVDRQMLRFIRDNDTLGFQEYCESLEKTAITDSDMTNKSMIECAMFKALLGLLDPRDVEQKTMAFQTYERILQKKAKA